MPTYQPALLDQSLIAVNRAVEMAWSQQRNHLGYRVHSGESLDGGIPDLSLEAAQRSASIGAGILELLAPLDDARLPHEYALTSKLLRYYATAWSKDAERYWLAVDLSGTQLYGPFAQTTYTGGFAFNFISKALAEFRFDKDGDGDRYLALLSDVARFLGQIHARTTGQAERGIRIQRPQLPGVRALLLGLKAGADGAFRPQASRLSALADAEPLIAEVNRRVEQRILPAFDALLAQLDGDYERQAPEAVGMGALPGGAQVYDDLLRMHTTMEMTAEEVHAAGHARMARIETEMAALRQRLGYTGSAAGFAAQLRQAPAASAATPDEIGARMRRHKDRIERRFDEFFAQRPAREADLVRLPPALEGGMTWGYYAPPGPEQPRGLYHYNGSKPDSLAVIAAASVVFHELVPGHHLHICLQHDNPNLAPIRRHAFVNAYNEGWAEYAATLAGEMGLYDDPRDRYGRLCMDAFLTCRLVVDTGMNALGWSLERAQDYLREHTLCTPGEIESDTLRYSCGIPAQSLAYKLGDEYILRLRERLRGQLGERFDLRDFHGAILGCGGLPLPALEWHLERAFAPVAPG